MARVHILKTIKKRPLFMLLLAGFLCFGPSRMEAAEDRKFATDSCDPQYYESMESRAWLEAQREITQNQNLIFKPDSVLQYTCFDKFANVASKNAKNMFSGSTRWGTPPTDAGKALTDSVVKPASDWGTSNFDHKMLGGQSNITGKLGEEAQEGEYGCDTMKKVWAAAKCMNFMDKSGQDGFFTFKDYADAAKQKKDKRTLPTQCGNNPDYQGNVDKALVDKKTPWEEDPVTTYLDLLYPKKGGCGDESSKIKTGVIITQATQAEGEKKDYEETVCLVPGCHFDPKQDKCVQ